ncbi:MAG: glycosyltransferase [Chlamydiota bacterium]
MKRIGVFFLWVTILASTVFADSFLDESSLQYVQTEEDFRKLGLFSAMYQMAEKQPEQEGAIPKTLHFIWLGPAPFPAASAARLQGWIAQHPQWKVKLWMDEGSDLVVQGVERKGSTDFPLGALEKCYYASDNFGERSMLVRYAILLSEGGIYIDHDMRCLKPLDPLLKKCDFLCGMEPPASSILSSSVYASPHLLGAVPAHAVLQTAVKWLQKEWDRLEGQYPGSEPSEIYNRVLHRAYRALDIAIKSAHHRSGSRDVVFPPDYFSLQDSKRAQFAVHEHLGSWYRQSSAEEIKVQSLLERAIDKASGTFQLAIALTLINICAALLFFSQHFYRKKRV